MRFLGGLLAFILISDVFASEIVKVRLFTTSQSQIKIFENLFLTNTFVASAIKEPMEIKGRNLSVNANSVPDHVILHPRKDKSGGNGSIEVIAVLDMEDYLRGVLPHEMPLVWPLEALKAQAVVARSFTKKQMVARKDNPYHLDSTVNDQMYRYNHVFSAKEKENLEKALEETKDEILTDANGSAVKAVYHADCGGQTEKASQVWGQKEVEFSVKDSKCPSNPYSNWEYTISPEELKTKLKTPFIPKTLTVSKESLSERAQQMEVSGLSGRERLSSQEFRRLVGYSKLKSTKFQVQKINEGFLFKGSGFGHGVGLCQWGARSWAKSGLAYKEILKHYFPSYSLVKQ
ncbi:MAG: SpoIID/LytB domain-containing protein [Bdellovibrionota bacterium]